MQVDNCRGTWTDYTALLRTRLVDLNAQGKLGKSIGRDITPGTVPLFQLDSNLPVASLAHLLRFVCLSLIRIPTGLKML